MSRLGQPTLLVFMLMLSSMILVVIGRVDLHLSSHELVA
jgi:hypothetical protein